MGERRFYNEIGHYGNKLNPGESFTLIRKIDFNSWGAAEVIGPEIEKGMAKLIAERKASISKEEAIFDRLNALGVEWVQQAAQTLLIDKALEYLRVPKISHTGNQWKTNLDGSREISNLVYKMQYSITENSKIAASGWVVSWSVVYNIHAELNKHLPLYSYTVAGKDKKRYEDKAAAERYVQGRIDAYAHLFTELSPPVPEKEKFLFSFNGVLLPGYTLAERQPTPEELLDFLDDQDIPGEVIVEPAPERGTPEEKKKGKPGKAR